MERLTHHMTRVHGDDVQNSILKSSDKEQRDQTYGRQLTDYTIREQRTVVLCLWTERT